MTLAQEIAACDPFASSPADFRRLFLKARAMRDNATALSEQATANMLIHKVSQLVEERAHGVIDLSDPRASKRIAARAR
ncbi:MAG TPA: hypothetical protein VIG24_13020 [Acidimicrobiia bacterium]